MSEPDEQATSHAERDAERDERARLERAREEHERRVRSLARRIAWPRRGFAILGLIAATLLALGALNALDRVPAQTLAAEVVARTGPAPAALHERCEIAFEPNVLVANTTVTIDCGGHRIYGWEGFGVLRCETAGGRVSACVDSEERLRFDGQRGRVELTGPGWTLTLALPGPRSASNDA